MKRRRGIGIDARMHNHSGIGQYITMLLRHLPFVEKAPTHNYLVFSEHRFFDAHLRHVATRSNPLSLWEQIDIPFRKNRMELGVFHSPQFNIPLLSCTRQITTIHDCVYTKFPQEFANGEDRILYAIMFRLALRKSKKIIAVSRSTKEDLVSLFKTPEEKIRVIHEGVGERFFRKPLVEQTESIRKRYGLEGKYVLFVGLRRPRKNIARILRAFAAARSSLGSEVKLVLAGPADMRFIDVSEQAKKLGISDGLIETGLVPHRDLPALYHSAECLFFPTLHEGFGLPVLEAMAAGVPVITSRRPAHMEVAGDAAMLVDPLDVEEMARGIVKMVNDKNLQEEYRIRGLKRAKLFSWEKCAAETLEAYDEVLNA